MKKQQPKSEMDAKSSVTICEFDLEKDTPILCTPTGEQWRIASIDADKISFEKIS